MELAKAYEPGHVESRTYARWRDGGLFTPTPGEGTPYCITIPPPNITGSLHIGHALNHSVLDLYTRMNRMQGRNTLCLPGTDHASIATQNVVERELEREGLTRHDLGREAFLERCWAWREQYGTRICHQLERLGCSYDWSRLRFTMDEPYVDAIYEEFMRWWDRGLIYRGARVVNWCPRCRSAISDIEVDSEDRAGHLYHFRYPFADGSGHITIATTRPETMLGDTAVAVNPADERYAGLVGKAITLPLAGREIPLIADEHARVDFGTGALKITPAHDLDDFEVGLRHRLPQVVVVGEGGEMTEAAGPRYAGLDRFECRKRVLEDMAALGLLEKTEPYTIKAPLCDRCKTMLEPLLSEQWFVKQAELAAAAMQVVREDRIRIYPARYRRIYLDWLENIRDWCISRQLWWGHRIPVWWTEDGRHGAGRSVEDAAARLGVPADALRQDEDVLDTWFSSAIWPQATLGWPRETDDLDFWYPTNLLSTAQEILYLWVARMVMTGMDFVGEVPFRDVYIHATVLDEKGERMSKSKGNGIDPLDMIDRYGADALRFSLLQNAGMNQDIRFSEDRVRLAGQFCNKLWNAGRFVLTSLDAEDAREAPMPLTPEASLAVADRWILSRLQGALATVHGALATYDIDEAARALYAFLWDDYCDWYLEMAKPRLREPGEDRRAARAVLAHVLDTTLRALHPFVPFITEELWQAGRQVLAGAGVAPAETGSDPTVMTQPYPEADAAWADERSESRMALVIEVTRALRNLRAEAGIAPGARLVAAVAPAGREEGVTLSDNAALIAGLARLSDLTLTDAAPSGDGTWVGTPLRRAEVFLEIGSALDVPRERERLDREIAAVDRDLAGLQVRLNNPQFVERAAPAAVEKARSQAAELTARREALVARLEALK